MDAIRCPECGDVRWSFLGLDKPKKCEICGAAMVPERRRPLAMSPARLAQERRDVTATLAGPRHR